VSPLPRPLPPTSPPPAAGPDPPAQGPGMAGQSGTRPPRARACSAKVDASEEFRVKFTEDVQSRLAQFEEVRGSIDRYRELTDTLAADLKAHKKLNGELAAALKEKDVDLKESQKCLLQTLSDKKNLTDQLSGAVDSLRAATKLQQKNGGCWGKRGGGRAGARPSPRARPASHAARGARTTRPPPPPFSQRRWRSSVAP